MYDLHNELYKVSSIVTHLVGDVPEVRVLGGSFVYL